ASRSSNAFVKPWAKMSATVRPCCASASSLSARRCTLVIMAAYRSGTIPVVGSLRSGLRCQHSPCAPRLHFSVQEVRPEYPFSPFTFPMTFIAPGDLTVPSFGPLGHVWTPPRYRRSLLILYHHGRGPRRHQNPPSRDTSAP